jgi:large subunit ribosomal protein L3
MIGLIGKKIGITHLFKENGDFIPVTVIEAGPCRIFQKKTEKSDGYNAVQLGFGELPEKKAKKPALGHSKKVNSAPQKILREFRLNPKEIEKINAGEELTISIFKKGEYVDVTGDSKGKGFSGVMKRHGFSGAPASHGSHYFKRHGGSIGGRYPQHTRKGTRMAGRMGNEQVTIQNLEIADIREKNNLILIKGSIPGNKNSFVLIKKAKKRLPRSEGSQ